MDRAKLKGYAALLAGVRLGHSARRRRLAGDACSAATRTCSETAARCSNTAAWAHSSHRLKLDDAQEDRVRDILGKYGKQRRVLTREIMDRCGAPLHAEKAQMDGEIRALLRPDQQARYDQLIKDSERHPPPGGPLEPLP